MILELEGRRTKVFNDQRCELLEYFTCFLAPCFAPCFAPFLAPCFTPCFLAPCWLFFRASI